MTPSALAILGLALLGLYSLAMGRAVERQSSSRQRWHLLSFAAGLLATLVALRPSPELLGADHRFATNMVQLLLVFEVAPPLLLWGLHAVVPAPPVRWDALGRRLTAPLLTGIVSGATLVLWHLPSIFATASGSLAIWTLKQALLLAVGLVAWAPVAGPVAAWRPPQPVQLLYLFVWRTPMLILGAIIAFAERLIYPARAVGLEICAPASLPDQQMAGVVMLTLSGLTVFVIFSVVFFRWAARS